jgi:hypothetical protein
MNRYIYVAQVSIPAEHREIFDALYDSEHVANLLTVPGVRSCRRFELEWSEPEMAQYLTIYEVDHPDVPKSAAWKAASNTGDWAVKVRPHFTVRLHGLYRAVGDKPEAR